jgi:uncharacterized OB-fold protein
VTRIPYVDYLILDPDPYLIGNRCSSCKAIYLDRRNACARCGGRDFETAELARTGAIRAFTVVHRATPDVAVPYVSIIVDLDGGGTVKGNLVGSDHDPASIPLGGPVRLATRTAAEDAEGTQAVTFAFRLEPASDSTDTSRD